MLNVVAQGTAESIGIGAAGTLALALAGMLVKRGVTGTFSIGGSGRSTKNGDYVTSEQCRRNHEEQTKHNADLQDLRDKQAQERHQETIGAIKDLKDDFKQSVRGIHQRIDDLQTRPRS